MWKPLASCLTRRVILLPATYQSLLMGNIPPGGQGAARGFLWRGWLSPWHPPGSPGLGRSWSDHKTFTEGAALLPGAGAVLSHGERLVQPSGAWLRSPILCHRVMGPQHQAQHQELRGKSRGASVVRGDDEGGHAGLGHHLSRVPTLGKSELKNHLKKTLPCSG